MNTEQKIFVIVGILFSVTLIFIGIIKLSLIIISLGVVLYYTTHTYNSVMIKSQTTPRKKRG